LLRECWWTYGSTSVLGKVVSGDEATSDALIEASPAVVGSVNYSVLETTRVCEVQVQLAVLALVGSDGARANVCLELIEPIDISGTVYYRELSYLQTHK
jgi:hypothetical protein